MEMTNAAEIHSVVEENVAHGLLRRGFLSHCFDIDHLRRYAKGGDGWEGGYRACERDGRLTGVQEEVRDVFSLAGEVRCP